MTRKFPRNSMEDLFQGIEALRKDVDFLTYNKEKSLPFRDKDNFPPGVEGQAVLAEGVPTVIVPIEFGEFLFEAMPVDETLGFQDQVYTAGSIVAVTLVNPVETGLVRDYDHPMWENSSLNTVIVLVKSIYNLVSLSYDNDNHSWYRLNGTTKTLLWSKSKEFVNGSGYSNDEVNVAFTVTDSGDILIAWNRMYDTQFLNPGSLTPAITAGMSNPSRFDYSSLYHYNFSTNTSTEILRMSDISSIASSDGTFQFGTFYPTTWSPSGDKLIFQVDNFPYSASFSPGYNRANVYLICDYPSGSSPTKLLAGGYADLSGTVYEDTLLPVPKFNPADPTQIFFVQALASDGSNSGIGRVNDDGTGITTIYYEFGVIQSNLEISPLGNFIAFINSDSKMAVISMDGTSGTLFPAIGFTMPTGYSLISWSPDETHLCVMMDTDIWVLNLSSGNWTNTIHLDDTVVNYIDTLAWAFRPGVNP